MKVHHVALTVGNLDKSISFYTSAFGCKAVKRFERKDLGGKAAFLKCHNILLELWQFNSRPEKRDLNGGSGKRDLKSMKTIGLHHLAFQSEAIDRAYLNLIRAGYDVSEPKKGASGGYYFFVKDPDRIMVEIYAS